MDERHGGFVRIYLDDEAISRRFYIFFRTGAARKAVVK